jgi:hypothetical protein
VIPRRAGLKGSDRPGDRDTCPEGRDLSATNRHQSSRADSSGSFRGAPLASDVSGGRLVAPWHRPLAGRLPGIRNVTALSPRPPASQRMAPGRSGSGTMRAMMTSALARSGSAGVVSTTVGLSRVGRRPVTGRTSLRGRLVRRRARPSRCCLSLPNRGWKHARVGRPRRHASRSLWPLPCLRPKWPGDQRADALEGFAARSCRVLWLDTDGARASCVPRHYRTSRMTICAASMAIPL